LLIVWSFLSHHRHHDSRFIINLPQDERNDIVRVMFQVELAHWFYVDFHCVEKGDLPKLHLKTFAKIMFEHVSFLREHLQAFDDVMEKWREYKSNVPTYGAIILDESLENVRHT
jgi:mRNA-decapping enzyme subunit 2